MATFSEEVEDYNVSGSRSVHDRKASSFFNNNHIWHPYFLLNRDVDAHQTIMHHVAHTAIWASHDVSFQGLVGAYCEFALGVVGVG
jgi:hypothetical protein